VIVTALSAETEGSSTVIESVPVVITERVAGVDAVSTVPAAFSGATTGARAIELPELSDRTDPADAVHPARPSAATSRSVVTGMRLMPSR
jgi:hypothetical protein